MIAHLARNPDVDKIRVRIRLEDLTNYAGTSPDRRLHVEVEGDVEREP
jgi:hypothetical protein